MLAAKRSAGFTPVVNVRKLTTCMPLPSLALKSRGEVTRSPKQGYQWPHMIPHSALVHTTKAVKAANALAGGWDQSITV